jgi:hypothetical protein
VPPDGAPTSTARIALFGARAGPCQIAPSIFHTVSTTGSKRMGLRYRENPTHCSKKVPHTDFFQSLHQSWFEAVASHQLRNLSGLHIPNKAPSNRKNEYKYDPNFKIDEIKIFD